MGLVQGALHTLGAGVQPADAPQRGAFLPTRLLAVDFLPGDSVLVKPPVISQKNYSRPTGPGTAPKIPFESLGVSISQHKLRITLSVETIFIIREHTRELSIHAGAPQGRELWGLSPPQPSGTGSWLRGSGRCSRASPASGQRGLHRRIPGQDGVYVVVVVVSEN